MASVPADPGWVDVRPAPRPTPDRGVEAGAPQAFRIQPCRVWLGVGPAAR